MPKPRRQWVKRTAVVVVVAGLLVVGVLAINSYLDPFDDRPFDAAAWATASSSDRGPMARDAVRHIPAGTSTERVRELLGDTDDVTRRADDTIALSAYYLGSWSAVGPYGLDSAFLYVHFDGDGRVVAAEITGG